MVNDAAPMERVGVRLRGRDRTGLGLRAADRHLELFFIPTVVLAWLAAMGRALPSPS
jgi:hypothetical protein